MAEAVLIVHDGVKRRCSVAASSSFF